MSSVHDHSRELLRAWPIVAACFVGLVVAVGTVVTYTAGVFSVAITRDFGWTQADFTLALMCFYYALVPGSIICGQLVDRWGPRRLILASCIGLACGLAALSALPASLPLFCIAYAAIGLIAMGTLPVTYSRVIAGRFERSRGTALGIAMTGVGVGSAVLPTLVQVVIDLWGWRVALDILAAAVILFGLTSAWLYIPAEAAGRSVPAAQGGARKAWTRAPGIMLGLGAISLISGVVLTGLVVNLVPLAVSKGLKPSQVILVPLAMGLSVIVGRLCIGVLMDWLQAGRVLAFFLLGPVIGALLLGLDPAFSIILAAAVLIGLAQGAEVDAVAYLVSRHFPKETFGVVYGIMFALFTVGAANGSLLFARLQLTFEDYAPGLSLFGGLAAACALTSFALPREPATRRAGSGPD